MDKIRSLVSPKFWSHCPGKENPADLPSRGLTVLELTANQLWRCGPDWLRNTSPPLIVPPTQDIPELCTAELKVGTHSLLIPPSSCRLSDIIDVKRFSSMDKLCRVTSRLLLFLKILKRTCESPVVTADVMAEAERMWVIELQSTLEEDPKFPSWKTQFGLFKDNNQIWRCGGRLQNASMSFSSKHPIFLLKGHPLTRLIVQSAHQRVQHNGARETLGEVRSKYWIVHGRSLARAVIHRCTKCRRYEGRPFIPPPAPPLPAFRVTEVPAFTYTAVDFAGPLYVGKDRGEDGNKVWICLFTCCVTRAVHLDLVRDMLAPTFIRALKRFAARRGLPRQMLSDNAKTFKATAKTLKTIFDSQDVKDYLSGVGIKWKFNLEKAPWWGGVFERMVRSTKRCLKKVVGQARFSFDELHTALVEIEGIINSRPLCYLDAGDVEEPLTPSHLLVGRRLLNLPDNLTHFEDEDDPDFEVTEDVLQRRVKYLSSVLNHFWKRWSKEYLVGLRDAHRQMHSSSLSPTTSVGDVVLVHEKDHPRGFWKLAKVQKLIVGVDGHTRGALLKVADKSGKPTTLRRPVQLLYPIGVVAQSQDETEPDNSMWLILRWKKMRRLSKKCQKCRLLKMCRRSNPPVHNVTLP